MKKKLFAVAIVVSLYVLFMFIFSATDERGQVSEVLSEIGLSETNALAATQLEAAEGKFQPSFYGPMSRRPKKSRTDKRGKTSPQPKKD